jgi:hypothetical protein
MGAPGEQPTRKASSDPVACRELYVGPPSWARVATWSLIASFAFVAFTSLIFALDHDPLGALGVAPLLVTLGLHAWARSRASLGPGTASVRDGNLVVAGARRTRRVALDRIASGSSLAAAVELRDTSGRMLRLVAEEPVDASLLLEATGTATRQRSVTFPLRNAIGPFVSGLLFYVLLIGPLTIAAGDLIPSFGLAVLAAQTLALILSVVLARRLARPHFTIGVDGLRIHKGFRRRFISHADILALQPMIRWQRVNAAGPDVTSALRVQLVGEHIDLPIVAWSEDDRRRALSRWEEARAASVATDGAAHAAFARKDRPISAWRDDLRRLVSADPGFRRRSMTCEHARAVIADATAPLEHRIGAVLALRDVDREDAIRQVRIAADAAADEDAKAALEAALAEDAAVEEALTKAKKRRASTPRS